MANTIKIKRSAVQGKVPTTGDLQLGELAVNTYDGKLYTKKSVGGIETIVDLSAGTGGGGGSGAYTVSATAPVGPSAGDRWLDSDNGIEYTYVNDGSSSAWVETGAPGIGPKGDTGTAATVAVGTTTTGAAGTSASVTNSGTSSAATLNFTIPRGDTGATGAAATIAVGTTTTGAAGSSASVTNSGTSGAAVFNFTVPRGDKGDAATVAVGTTTTGSPGTNASVTNSGNSSAATFNFTIPRGDTGATGAQGPMAPKSVTVISPTASEKICLFFTNVAITLTEIRSVIAGGTSVDFRIRYGTDFSATGTETTTNAIVCNSTTTGVSTTTFSSASIPADRFVWLVTSAVSGSVAQLHVSLEFV